MQQLFHGEVGYSKWSSTTWGRGKRKDIVTKGLYCVVHLSTGKFIIGRSKTVSRDVDIIIDKIKRQASPWAFFNQRNHIEDGDVELLEFAANPKDAEAIERRIRKHLIETGYGYLILN